MTPVPDYPFLPGTMRIDRGTPLEYRTLERFHYIPSRPATWAAVAIARYVPDDGLPCIVGVAVLSYPSALHRARHRTFGLKSFAYGERLRWVNVNIRTISRVIVHPQFRSIGLSTQLIHWLCDQVSTRFIEASARMGQVHPLFERAGFARVDPLDADEPVYFWREREQRREGIGVRRA